jgi:hypothetical protein
MTNGTASVMTKVTRSVSSTQHTRISSSDGHLFESETAPHAEASVRFFADLSVWRTIMEDMHGIPLGPQFYLLSEEGYRELKSIQTMLRLMAGIGYTDEDDANGNVVLTIRRAEICFAFEEISAQIGAALERLGKENWMRNQSRMWQ